jgi:Cd(II)/Pb(II)-responsive transcriptional regulator
MNPSVDENGATPSDPARGPQPLRYSDAVGEFKTLKRLQGQLCYLCCMNDLSRIGDIASATGCPVETIRYYERKGLLTLPERSEGNYRLYAQAHMDQLRFIRNCRSLDMTLDEIRSLLALREAQDETCADVNDLLDEHIGHVAVRIAELRALRRQLIDLRHQCRAVRAVAKCGILQTLESESSSSTGKRGDHGHLHRTHK